MTSNLRVPAARAIAPFPAFRPVWRAGPRFRKGKSMAVYRDRFADAGDFTFFFVGNFTLEEANSVAMQLRAGSLPGHLALVEQQVVQPGAKP